MRIAHYSAIGALSLALCGAVSNAQCTNGFTQQTLNCAYSDECESSTTINVPNGGQDGVVVECGSASCCGQLFTTCWSGGNCEAAKRLRLPAAAQERLRTLAAQSEVLVADCKGRYALYQPEPAKERSGAGLALLNDHILR
jgi:hypothetical protein